MALGSSDSTIIKVKTHHECPRCNKKGHLSFEVKASYFYLAFIPFINTGKSVLAECSNCKKITPEYKMPAPLKKAAGKEKRIHQIPVWNFLGIILLIGIGPTINSMVQYSSFYYDDYPEDYYEEYEDYESDQTSVAVQESTESDYILNPMIGDVYEYLIEDGVYSTMKVEQVTSYEVYVKHNTETVSDPAKMYQIDLVKNYPDEISFYSLDRIATMYWTDTIISIFR